MVHFRQNQVLGQHPVTIREMLSGNFAELTLYLDFNTTAARLTEAVAREFEAGEGYTRIPAGSSTKFELIQEPRSYDFCRVELNPLSSPQILTTIGGAPATYNLNGTDLEAAMDPRIRRGSVQIIVQVNGVGQQIITDDFEGNLVNTTALPGGGSVKYDNGKLTGTTATLAANSQVIAIYDILHSMNMGVSIFESHVKPGGVMELIKAPFLDNA